MLLCIHLPLYLKEDRRHGSDSTRYGLVLVRFLKIRFITLQVTARYFH